MDAPVNYVSLDQGIRMALESRPEDAIRLFLRQSSGLGLAGLAVGLVGAFLLTPLWSANSTV